MVHCMCIHRVSSVPTQLIVAGFFVYASLPFAEHCLKDTVAYMKGKKKMPSRGPRRGRKCYVTLPFSGVPKNKGGQNQKWLPCPYLLEGRKEGGNARRGLRVPNPNSRGQTTKRALTVPNPNSRGHKTKRGL